MRSLSEIITMNNPLESDTIRAIMDARAKLSLATLAREERKDDCSLLNSAAEYLVKAHVCLLDSIGLEERRAA